MLGGKRTRNFAFVSLCYGRSGEEICTGYAMAASGRMQYDYKQKSLHLNALPASCTSQLCTLSLALCSCLLNPRTTSSISPSSQVAMSTAQPQPQVLVPTAINRALSRFRNSLDSEEKKAFNHASTESDVMALIENLEAEQGARGCLQNMTRIKPFIKGLSQYATVIEVFVQAKPEILPFIWVRWCVLCELRIPLTPHQGPIKLLLQVPKLVVVLSSCA